MAEQCTERSAATSSSAASWWPDVHASSLPSWNIFKNSCNPPNPNCNSTGEEDVSISTSFTNASNHSGLSIDSSRRLVESTSTNELHGEGVSENHHIWSQVLLNTGTSRDLQRSTDVGDSILNAFSSKNLSTGMFEPACDYLKKMDSGWDFASPTSLNIFQNNFNGFNVGLYESEKPCLVSNWSIAPPDSEINNQFDTYSDSGTYACHGHGGEMNVKNEHREVEAAEIRRAYSSSGTGYHEVGLNNMVVGDKGAYTHGISDLQCTNGRNFADVKFGSSCLSKPLLDINASRPMLRTLNLSDRKKQTLQASYQLQTTVSKGNTLTRNMRRGHRTANEGKRKRSEDNSGTLSKKPKHENSTNSSAKVSAKVQIPKAKLGDKITALQQIVSPFGKTDTASVLWEAISYIKCLQEQVQLLSNPYKKINASKDAWGGLDRKDREDVRLDLKSRGLCLVPISCTPKMYHENNGSDYWTPPYRGLFYR